MGGGGGAGGGLHYSSRSNIKPQTLSPRTCGVRVGLQQEVGRRVAIDAQAGVREMGLLLREGGGGDNEGLEGLEGLQAFVGFRV